MRFLHPELGWWIAGALAAAGMIRWRMRRFVAATTVRWLAAPQYRVSVFRRLPLVMLVGVVVLLGGALMQPVLPYSQVDITSRGLDIVIALDLSSSMLEEMGRIRPPRTVQNLTVTTSDSAAPRQAARTRLTATKDAIRSLVASRRDDRIALVVFSDNAYVISPLTFDHDYVIRYVDLIDDQLLRGEGLTAIGDGLALANDLLTRQSRGRDSRNRVVVLFTDGENNKGRDPLEVLGESHEAHIRVHMVGVDLEEEVRRKPQVQRVFQSVRRYGGRYFDANTGRGLELASQTIDRIEKGVLVSRSFVRNAPVYQWFALPALICLASAIGLRAIPYFIDYT
jgi:Ca-activated chloride channel family protein